MLITNFTLLRIKLKERFVLLAPSAALIATAMKTFAFHPQPLCRNDTFLEVSFQEKGQSYTSTVSPGGKADFRARKMSTES